MLDQFQQITKAIQSLSFNLEQEILKKFNITQKQSDLKQLKKKLKKNQIQQEDSSQKASQKLTKLLQQLYKYYQTTGKSYSKYKQIKNQYELIQTQKDKVTKNKTMTQNLFNGFKKKYDQQIQNAQKIQKQQEAKRKSIIQQLQQRIKVIQNKYQQTGKIKIQKYKQNQTLKHQLSKYQPHLTASESLADAQLKKKSIEIQIQMTTLKQKIQMMDNFKNMRVETQQKLKKSKQTQQKIGHRLTKLQSKQQQHKLLLAKGHLVFQDYKKAFNVLKDILPKKQKQAYNANQKLKKSVQVLNDFKKKITQMDKEYQKQTAQLQVLSNLESNLIKQLEES